MGGVWELGLLCLAAAALRPALSAPRKVVVVGGGLAGLSTARHLANASQEGELDILVLEGNEERPGGRIHTLHLESFPDFAVELGASWLHGGSLESQPLAQLCRNAGLPLQRNDARELGAMAFYRLSGVEAGWDEVLKVEELYELISDTVQERIEGGQTDLPLPVAMRARSPASFARVMDEEVVRRWGLATLEAYYGAKAEELSTLMADGVPGSPEATDLHTYDDLVLPEGTEGIVDVLLNHGRPFQLSLGSRVRRVERSREGSGWRLEVEGGQGRGGVVEADVVVLALPLGVLQEKGAEMVPELPEAQLSALARMGVGNLVKVVLVFDRVFWADRDVIGTEASPAGYPVFLLNVARVSGVPALVGLVSGESADEADATSEAEVASKVLSVLSTIYGQGLVQSRQLVDFRVSRWASDPLSRGAFSFGKFGMRPSDAYLVREPLFGDTLFLAGEYTGFPEHQHGTLAAAFDSGTRVADRILRGPKPQTTQSSRSSPLSPASHVTLFPILVLSHYLAAYHRII